VVKPFQEESSAGLAVRVQIHNRNRDLSWILQQIQIYHLIQEAETKPQKAAIAIIATLFVEHN
jgi:hypothetical protein